MSSSLKTIEPLTVWSQRKLSCTNVAKFFPAYAYPTCGVPKHEPIEWEKKYDRRHTRSRRSPPPGHHFKGGPSLVLHYDRSMADREAVGILWTRRTNFNIGPRLCDRRRPRITIMDPCIRIQLDKDVINLLFAAGLMSHRYSAGWEKKILASWVSLIPCRCSILRLIFFVFLTSRGRFTNLRSYVFQLINNCIMTQLTVGYVAGIIAAAIFAGMLLNVFSTCS